MIILDKSRQCRFAVAAQTFQMLILERMLPRKARVKDEEVERLGHLIRSLPPLHRTSLRLALSLLEVCYTRAASFPNWPYLVGEFSISIVR